MMTSLSNPYRWLSDDDLIEIANLWVSDLSYYAAAEYPQWGMEREARQRAERRARPIQDEMRRRGLRETRPGLVRMS